MQDDVAVEPGQIIVKDGQVLIHCSGGGTIALTPDDAVIASDRLFQAGLEAKKQQGSRESAGG